MEVMSQFAVLLRSIDQRNTDKHGFSWEDLSMILQINKQNKYDHREVCLKQIFLEILFSRFGTFSSKKLILFTHPVLILYFLTHIAHFNVYLHEISQSK